MLRIFRPLLAALALQTCAVAHAGVDADVHRLLIAERFDEAQARTTSALTAVQGDGAAAQRRRLAALGLLITTAQARHGFRQAATLAWIRQAQIIAATLYADSDKRRAKWLALEGVQALGQAADPAGRERGKAMLERAGELLVHGTASLDAIDESEVDDLLVTASLTTRKYDEGLLAAQRAEALMRHARSAWEQRWRGLMLGSLGLLQAINGQGAAARANANAAVALIAKICGTDSIAYADTISRLGQVQTYSDDYAGVRDSLQSAVDIYRRRPWLGVKSTDRAVNSLANALRRLGDYAHARALFEEVIAHNEVDAQGRFDEMLPDSLNTLAGLENEIGNVDRARQLYERALDLEDKLYGASQPLYLEKPLINLGNLALQQQDLAASEGYFQRAAVLDATDHSGMLANYLIEGQADLALAQGHPERAESLLSDSIEQTVRRYGGQHRWLVARYCALATARARLGKNDDAFDAALTGERLRIDLLRGIAPALSEEHALNFKGQLGSCSGVLLALAAAAPDSGRALRAWQLVAESRLLTTRLQAARIAAARNADEPAGKERWSRWEKAARGYSEIMLRNAVSGADVQAAHDALNAAERDLGEAKMASMGLSATTDLAALLAHETQHVVVAYAVVRHPLIDRQAHGPRANGKDLYALVSDGTRRHLHWLGDAEAIDARIDRWLKLLRNPASDAVALDAAGTAVRALIWDPLALAADRKNVLVVPNGALFRVNFAALPDAGGGYLVERGWRFHLLDSEQDLAPPADAAAPERLLVLGAPDFGAMPAVGSTLRSCAAGFAALGGAAAEARELARAWRESPGTPVKLLLDHAASKAALEEAAAHFSVLHFATHALDIGGDCEATAPSRGVTLDAMAAPALAHTHSAALALAGANRLFTEGSADGILTSAEAATLPLQRAHWVVLSACDTGLGEVVADEGVFGLRRGFRLAGAHTVLMSLWRVDDAATAELMQSLYAARWQAHADTPQALASAELATLAARRERGESTHPYYWAAFVASGDWR